MGMERGLAVEMEKGITENAPKEIRRHSSFDPSGSDKKKGSVDPL